MRPNNAILCGNLKELISVHVMDLPIQASLYHTNLGPSTCHITVLAARSPLLENEFRRPHLSQVYPS